MVIKKLFITVCFVFLFFITPAAILAAELYPDLLTIPPSDLRFAHESIHGQQKTVLRFTNTVWNYGRGPLTMYGSTTSDAQTHVTQRIYNEDGHYTEATSGTFVWHPAHNHWHFEKFAMYELWERSAFETWIANGRTGSTAAMRGYKTTFCIRETQLIHTLPGTPSSPVHTECGTNIQGLSVGWGDSYRFDIPEQWIDIGDAPLSDGYYILRSVADPDNVIKESPNNDPYYESHTDNEGITPFIVHEGIIYPN